MNELVTTSYVNTQSINSLLATNVPSNPEVPANPGQHQPDPQHIREPQRQGPARKFKPCLPQSPRGDGEERNVSDQERSEICTDDLFLESGIGIEVLARDSEKAVADQPDEGTYVGKLTDRHRRRELQDWGRRISWPRCLIIIGLL